LSSNRDLAKEITAGRFREDLYYRLNVVTLITPPLRERAEDIPILAQHFLEYFSRKNNKQIKGFSPQAMDPWPGNVRELMNAVERGVVLSRGDYLAEEELALLLPGGEAAGGSTVSPDTTAAAGSMTGIPGERAAVQGVAQNETVVPGAGAKSLDEVERETILRMLAAVGGNKSEAARRLGITRRTLHQKLKKYGAM